MKIWEAVKCVTDNHYVKIWNSKRYEMKWSDKHGIQVQSPGGGSTETDLPVDGWEIHESEVTWPEASKAWSEGNKVFCIVLSEGGAMIHTYSNPNKFVDEDKSPVSIDLVNNGKWFVSLKDEVVDKR